MNGTEAITAATRRGLLGAATALTVMSVATLRANAGGKVLHREPSDADATLIQMAEEIEASNAESDRWHRLADQADDRTEEKRLWDLGCADVSANWDRRAVLASIPAKTIEGLGAKARIVRMYDYPGDGFACPYDDHALAYSLANDLLGLSTVWNGDGT
jgi:hypothetical protein